MQYFSCKINCFYIVKYYIWYYYCKLIFYLGTKFRFSYERY